MAANLETMFSVREVPWHGQGTIVQEAPDSNEALRLAGLDWTVEGKPIYDNMGRVIAGYKANTRSSDGKVLGIVSNRYKIVQNADAFQFTDNLIGGDVRYETAGSLQGGKKIWLLAKMPETKVCDDSVAPYVCFTNSHDGTGAVKAIMTPVRVVCNNTLNLALRTAKRSWSMRHQGNIEGKLEEARQALELAEIYMDSLAKEAEEWANITVNTEHLHKILDAVFPEKANATDRAKENIKRNKDQFMACVFAPDLVKFVGTAWGVINAAADFVGHTAPSRNTKSYAENNWNRIMDGHPLVDRVVSLATAK